jgi:tRNA(Arg) A34 adenosine deaminase TadA
LTNQQLTEQDHVWLDLALENSRRAAQNGGSPFGAVVADGSKLFGAGGNETVLSKSPIRHAEIVALDAALGGANGVLPSSTTLYASCAPCIMCLGAAYYSGIHRIVYALDIADVIKLGSEDLQIEPPTINDLLKLGFSVFKGVGRAEALSIVTDVFQRTGHL